MASAHNVVLEYTRHASEGYAGNRFWTSYESKDDLDRKRDQYGEDKKMIIVAEGVSDSEAIRLCSMTVPQARLNVGLHKASQAPDPDIARMELLQAATILQADQEILDSDGRYRVVIEYTKLAGNYAGTRFQTAYNSKKDLDEERSTFGPNMPSIILAEGVSDKVARILTALTPAEARLRVAIQESEEMGGDSFITAQALSTALFAIRSDMRELLNTRPTRIVEALSHIKRN